MDITECIFELSAAGGVTGLNGAVDAAATELSRYGEVLRDPFGGLRVTISGRSAHHILLDAHIDEIGLIVTAVEEGGFVRFGKCGGVDVRVLGAADVTIWGRQPVPGVVCCRVPHLTKPGDKLPDIEDMAIDTGLTGDGLREMIQPGDRITFAMEPAKLLNGKITGKSLDNRSGCAVLIDTAARIIEGGKPACTVTICLSEQEEVGCRGAASAVYAVHPDEAIVVDVSFGDMEGTPAHQCGALSKGPMIGISPTLSGEVTDRLIQLAEQKGIPYQREVMGGRTSTNADAISVAGAGVRAGLVSIPLRYMHTPVEVIDGLDVSGTAALLAAYIDAGGIAHD